MSSVDSFSAAFEGIRSSLRDNRLAHGFLVVGSVAGSGGLFARSLTQLLFCTSLDKPCGTCDACRHVAERHHPDVTWLEPESKGRVIKVEEQVRPLIQQLSQKAFGGGWKVGVILQADRLSEGAANAFLKTLEEPPPKTVLILVTDSPQSILPTIVSRCQRVVVGEAHDAPKGEWQKPLLELLGAPPPTSLVDALARAAAISALIENERERIGKEVDADAGPTDGAGDDVDSDVRDARVQAKVLQVRAEILRMLIQWQRDVFSLVAGGDEAELVYGDRVAELRRHAQRLSYGDASRGVQASVDLVRRLDRNVPELAALERFVIEAWFPAGQPVSNAR